MHEQVQAATTNEQGERTTFRSPWLNSAQAADYLGSMSPKTLAAWRGLGKGPRYRVVGQRLVRYHRDDLDAFAFGRRNQSKER